MINTKQRIIPNGYKEYKPELGDYPKDMFACYVSFENQSAIFFTGKQTKKTWWNRFNTIDDMKNKINNSIIDLMTYEENKMKRRESKKLALQSMDASGIKVGDVYSWMGGYNCTKNAYVKVTELLGKNKFKAVQLSKYQVDGDWMNGNVAPVIESNNGEVILKAVPSYDGKIMLRDTKNAYHDDYSKWNGKPDWENCD